MKNSTSVGLGGIVGVILGAGVTIAYNKIKSSKEEKIELDETTIKNDSVEDSTENKEE